MPAGTFPLQLSPFIPAGKYDVRKHCFTIRIRKVLRQAQRRKTELEQVTKERDEWKGKAETALKEQEKATKEVESIRRSLREVHRRKRASPRA